MPSIYPLTTDGGVINFITGSPAWADVRDKVDGTVVGTTATTLSVEATVLSGKGTGFVVRRSFFEFDTSSITATLASATFKLNMSAATNNCRTIMVKSTAFTSSGNLHAADFNNLDFSTPYSGESGIDGGGSNGIFDFTLNATALADIKNDDSLKIALINFDHDYSDVAPSAINRCTHSTGNQSGVNRPEIEYALAPFYGNKVTAVPPANISKVDGVATANIEKVIGV
tara:strand:- start:272 stop:955 length:684 start_codon:yes stop_codon:yes gene_type:complete